MTPNNKPQHAARAPAHFQSPPNLPTRNRGTGMISPESIEAERAALIATMSDDQRTAYERLRADEQAARDTLDAIDVANLDASPIRTKAARIRYEGSRRAGFRGYHEQDAELLRAKAPDAGDLVYRPAAELLNWLENRPREPNDESEPVWQRRLNCSRETLRALRPLLVRLGYISFVVQARGNSRWFMTESNRHAVAYDREMHWAQNQERLEMDDEPPSYPQKGQNDGNRPAYIGFKTVDVNLKTNPPTASTAGTRERSPGDDEKERPAEPPPALTQAIDSSNAIDTTTIDPAKRIAKSELSLFDQGALVLCTYVRSKPGHVLYPRPDDSEAAQLRACQTDDERARVNDRRLWHRARMLCELHKVTPELARTLVQQAQTANASSWGYFATGAQNLAQRLATQRGPQQTAVGVHASHYASETLDRLKAIAAEPKAPKDRVESEIAKMRAMLPKVR